MKLEAVVRDEQSFLYMERYVDQGAKSYSPAGKTEVPSCYRPESDDPFFDLLTVKAPIDPVAIFEGPLAQNRFMIPCFALYAGDLKHPDDPPLVVQMINRFGVDPAGFVVDQICVPLIESWSRVARELGLLLQSHAQNTLLEVDADLRPKRFVHRDFDVWIDLAARRRAELKTPYLGAGTRPDGIHPVQMFYILIYDRFIGHEFFDYLFAALKRFYPIDEDSIRDRVRKAFRGLFPDAERFFPRGTTCYFSREPPAGREYALEDLRQAPVWR